MKNFYSSLEKNERWNNELDILKQFSNLVEENEIISRSGCYYPRLKETKKRGRVAFLELYKKLCCSGKMKLMKMEDFELFVCKHKDWKVHILPTDKYGKMCTEWLIETETGDHVMDYLSQYEFLCTPNMPSITTEEEKIDNVSAIKNLANNLTIKKNEYLNLVKYFLGKFELTL